MPETCQLRGSLQCGQSELRLARRRVVTNIQSVMKLPQTPLIAVVALTLVGTLYAQQSQSIPKQFHGTWTSNKNGIHPENVELPVKISAKEISGHESTGQVTRVTQSGDKQTCVINIDAACEGMEGKETLTLILSRDGKSLKIEQDNPTTCAFGPSVLYRVR